MAMHSVAEMAGSTLASLRKIAKEKGQPLPVDLDDKDAVAEYMKSNNDKYVGEWNQQLKRRNLTESTNRACGLVVHQFTLILATGNLLCKSTLNMLSSWLKKLKS